MANYQTIVRLRPEVRDFIRNRRWVYRGEVVVYGANTRCDSFSTDAAGFRHSTFEGEALSLADCVQRERYGLGLGSSNLYGFGLAGNENTIPSLLAAKFGLPFANVSIPEANSRNLYSLLMATIARAKHPPAIVLHLSGGDFTSFCFTSISDPVFGSPNLKQIKAVLEERGGRPSAEQQAPAMFAYSTLWTRAIAGLCRSRSVPLVLGQDVTFFEKKAPSTIETECELGKPINRAQELQFATHRQFIGECLERRKALAADLNVPLAGPGFGHEIGFVDEFHYDREGTRMLAEQFAGAMEPLLC